MVWLPSSRQGRIASSSSSISMRLARAAFSSAFASSQACARSSVFWVGGQVSGWFSWLMAFCLVNRPRYGAAMQSRHNSSPWLSSSPGNRCRPVIPIHRSCRHPLQFEVVLFQPERLMPARAIAPKVVDHQLVLRDPRFQKRPDLHVHAAHFCFEDDATDLEFGLPC